MLPPRNLSCQGGRTRIFDLAQTAAPWRLHSEWVELYARIFENTPDAMIVVGPDGRIRALANARTPHARPPPEELVGQRVEVLVPNSDVAGHVAHRERFMANPRPAHGRDAGSHARQALGWQQVPADIMLSPLGEGSEHWCFARSTTSADRSLVEQGSSRARPNSKTARATDRACDTGCTHRASQPAQLWRATGIAAAQARARRRSACPLDRSRPLRAINDTSATPGDHALREVAADNSGLPPE